MIESVRGGHVGPADAEDTDAEETGRGGGPAGAGRGRRRRSGAADEETSGAAGLGRRRKAVALVAGGALVLTGAGVAASLVVKSPAQVAAEAKAPKQGVLTAPVEKRVLKDSVVLRGTVVAGQSVDVTVSASTGTTGASRAVVTKAPKPVGAKVTAGQVVAEVSGRPVFALKGKVPVYRDLKSGATGADVAQLQAALADLGHASNPDARGTFGAGTRRALASFYTSIGYDPVSAQTDGATAVRDAQDAVTSAERTAQDAEDADKARSTAATRRAVERAEQDLRRARDRLSEAQAEAGPMLPASEVVYLSAFPARVDSVSAVLGSAVTGKVMTLSAGRLVVDGYLQEAQKGLVRAGQKAEILQEQSGKETRARVRSVADTPEAAEQSGDSAAAPAGGGDDAGSGQQSETQGYRMVVAPDTPLASGAVGQDVRLTVEAASTEGEALVVPVTAVSAASDGDTVVTVVTTGGKQRRVPVRTGTTGDGYVEVRPSGEAELAAGDEVVTGVKAGAGDAR
ncbi:peptidoglycan-binding protein [Streptomyces sp. NPDC006422]|uniref:peptidoglycan-binding protein n=1 Tax=unclassified Streptomyces TaxID=2593676 RepID=UPI0033A741A9